MSGETKPRKTKTLFSSAERREQKIALEEDRAWQNCWKEIKTADAHLDLAFDLGKKRSYGRRKILEQDYLEGFQRAHLCAVISSLYVENQFLPEMGLRQALIQLEALLADAQESPEFFQIVTSREELVASQEKGKIAIVISFEGIEPIHQDLGMLSIFRRLGLRGVGVCWARRNEAADGSFFEEAPTKGYGGLTKFGKKLVQYVDRQELYLDLAHMNDEGFDEALCFGERPPMVSHTNCRSINPTMRNATDEQIQAIIQKGGFIGVNAMNFTVSDGKSVPETISGYCDHLDHIRSMGGENNLGFGFDFNDQILRYIPEEQLNLLPRKPFDCVRGYEEVEEVFKELKRRGYTQDQLQKLGSKNLMRYLLQVLPNKPLFL